jgi:hypothetical protein
MKTIKPIKISTRRRQEREREKIVQSSSRSSRPSRLRGKLCAKALAAGIACDHSPLLRRGDPQFIPAGRTKPLPNTIDTKGMHKLMRRPNVNHEQICLLIHTIVRGAAQGLWFATAEDRRDAISATFVFCLDRLKKFRVAVSENPAGYFDRMAYRKLCEVKARDKRIRDREVPLDDPRAAKIFELERVHG